MTARPRLFVELNYGVGTASPDALALDTGRLNINVAGPASSGSGFVLNSGILDTDTLAASASSPGYWTDLAEFCSRLSVHRGRSRSLESYFAGSMSADLENSDRRFDPTNTEGPYVVGGVSAIQPMRPIRIRAEHDGRSYSMFSGFVDAWDIDWRRGAPPDVEVSATDAFKVLADFDPLEVAPVGAGETSGARVNRVLDNAGWSAEARAIDAGNSTVQATTLARNALTELKLVADTERGQLFVDPEGKVTFRRRQSRIVDSPSAVRQALFGDGDGDELTYVSLAVAFDDELIRNKANVSRVGGTMQTAVDADSIARYLTHTFTRTDLIMETDTEAADYARSVVAENATGELRFDSLTLEPDPDPELWPYVLGLDIGHRVTIRRRPPGGGELIERECFIESVSHDVPADGKWRTVFALSDATGRGLVLDHATRGTLDTATNSLTY